MKTIPYPILDSLRHEEIEELTQSPDGFVVAAEGKVKDAIIAFLQNERRYRDGKKSVRDRIAYLWGGRGGFGIIPFVTVWNRALISGLRVTLVDEVDSISYFTFERA